MNIDLLPQELNSNTQFNSPIYMTRGFLNTYGKNADAISMEALEKIKAERVPYGADYLQIVKYNDKTFWIIDDTNHITVLMPEEY